MPHIGQGPGRDLHAGLGLMGCDHDVAGGVESHQLRGLCGGIAVDHVAPAGGFRGPFRGRDIADQRVV